MPLNVFFLWVSLGSVALGLIESDCTGGRGGGGGGNCSVLTTFDSFNEPMSEMGH